MVPKYKELSIKQYEIMLKKYNSLCFISQTIPQINDQKKIITFSILVALRYAELKTLKQEARKKRSVSEEPDRNEFIEVKEEIKKILMKYLHKIVRIN